MKYCFSTLKGPWYLFHPKYQNFGDFFLGIGLARNNEAQQLRYRAIRIHDQACKTYRWLCMLPRDEFLEEAMCLSSLEMVVK